MDSDRKAIMDAIVLGSDDPMGALLDNIFGGGLDGAVQVRRSRSASNASDCSESIPGHTFRSPDRPVLISNESHRGPPGPADKESKPKETERAEPKEDGVKPEVDEVVERAKPENLAEYKHALVRSIADKGKPAPEEVETKPDVDEVVERVKRENLDEYERAFIRGIVDKSRIDATFESLHLPEETVDTIRSLITLPLLYSQEFQYGILKQHTMSGALLFGPPGTGKTLLVQALAKESGARMISIKPSDILNKHVGESERLVRSLFKLARRLMPCVIFIDEIDALFGARAPSGQQFSALWHTSMLTEFMQEMDGLLSSNVVVIGATNRPFDLDDAVLRRLPCRVMIDLPETKARQEILRILLREEALEGDVRLNSLAGQTGRFSGSDLKNLCIAAAFNAVKEQAALPWKTGGNNPESGGGKAAVCQTKTEPATALGANYTALPEGLTANTSATTFPTINSNGVSSAQTRVLANRHFTQALNQICPSSSETQASLSEIRAWNLKFGSGASNSAGMGTSVPDHIPTGADGGVPSCNYPSTTDYGAKSPRRVAGIGGAAVPRWRLQAQASALPDLEFGLNGTGTGFGGYMAGGGPGGIEAFGNGSGVGPLFSEKWTR